MPSHLPKPRMKSTKEVVRRQQMMTLVRPKLDGPKNRPTLQKECPCNNQSPKGKRNGQSGRLQDRRSSWIMGLRYCCGMSATSWTLARSKSHIAPNLGVKEGLDKRKSPLLGTDSISSSLSSNSGEKIQTLSCSSEKQHHHTTREAILRGNDDKGGTSPYLHSSSIVAATLGKMAT